MRLFACLVSLGLLAGWMAEGARLVQVKDLLESRLARLGPAASHRAKREARRLSVRDLVQAGPQVEIVVDDVSQSVQGTRLVKMKEKFRGKEVYDGQMTIETDPSGNEILDASGVFVQDIEDDTDGSPDIYAVEALTNVLVEFGDTVDDARDVSIEEKVFFDNTEHAFAGYQVQYLVEEDGEPRRPTAIVHGDDGRVVLKWNSMTSFCSANQGSGMGGNNKTGNMYYNGADYSCLDVTRVGDICYLSNGNVTVVDMGGQRNYTITGAMPYDCHNATDSINGANSPSLDAFFIASTAYKMFDEWFNMAPLRNGMHLVVRVHFGENYPNAFWNGVNATFGDGRGSFHPFVSIDLVGHEIGHAIVEQYSGLIWFSEPGALNEAFADITGEVLERYIRGTPDWLVGYDTTKTEMAVRYFEQPEDNYISISTMDQFFKYMEPHTTGGILSRAFFRIVSHYNQSMIEAYRVFLHANRMYWNHMTDLYGGVCDLMKSVYDLGQPGDLYEQAFAETGIEVCNVSHHVVGLHNNVTLSNVTVSNSTRPVYTFGVPAEWTQSVFVYAGSLHGAVMMTITNQTWMKAYDPSQEGILAQGYDYVSFDFLQNPVPYVTITLSSNSSQPWTDVSVTAGYTCVEAGQAAHGYFEYMRKENCEGRSY